MSIILALVGSYLLGSIPSAWIAGKLNGIDIRAVGSGNSGATNALRVLGPIPAIFVVAADAGKGVIAVLAVPWALNVVGLPVALPLDALRSLCGAAAVIGHVFSVWIGFKGGKGVATGAAVVAALAPLSAVLCLTTFIAVAALTRYASLASISAAVLLPIAYLLTAQGASFSAYVMAFCLAATILVIVKHRANIRRLLRGEEAKIGRR